MVCVPPITAASLPLWGSLSCSSFWDSCQHHSVSLGPASPLGAQPPPPTLTSPTLSLRARLESLVPEERMAPRGRRDALDPLETLGPLGSWARR